MSDDKDDKRFSKSTDNVDSSHIFIFPFKWGKTKNQGKNRITNIETLQKKLKDLKYDNHSDSFLSFLTSLMKSSEWEKKEFNTSNKLDYNTYHYIYPFARDVVFDTADDDKKIPYHHLELKLCPKEYVIKVDEGQDDKTFKETYSLEVDKITLDIYDFEVGMLSFHLLNNGNKYSFDDVLNINFFGRRSFNPFFKPNKSVFDYGQKMTKLSEDYAIGSAEDFTQVPRSISIEPRSISTEPSDDNVEANEESIKHNPPKYYDAITQLLGNQIKSHGLVHLFDDRMFVISWCHNQNIINKSSDSRNKLEYGSLFEYTFIDRNRGLSYINDGFAGDLIDKSYYTRWMPNKMDRASNEEEGTFYGISRYSFVCLASEANYTQIHMRTMYWKMCKLVLLQKAGLLQFNEKIGQVSLLEPSGRRLEDISEVYQEFIKFKNKIKFNRVTEQDQGHEIYKQMIAIQELDKDLEELNGEMGELYQFANLLSQKEESITNRRLTKIATIFLPATLITSLFGMNLKDGWNFESLNKGADIFWPFWEALSIAFFATYVLYIFVIGKNDKYGLEYIPHIFKDKSYKAIFFLLLFLVSLCLLCYSLFQ